MLKEIDYVSISQLTSLCLLQLVHESLMRGLRGRGVRLKAERAQRITQKVGPKEKAKLERNNLKQGQRTVCFYKDTQLSQTTHLSLVNSELRLLTW